MRQLEQGFNPVWLECQIPHKQLFLFFSESIHLLGLELFSFAPVLGFISRLGKGTLQNFFICKKVQISTSFIVFKNSLILSQLQGNCNLWWFCPSSPGVYHWTHSCTCQMTDWENFWTVPCRGTRGWPCSGWCWKTLNLNNTVRPEHTPTTSHPWGAWSVLSLVHESDVYLGVHLPMSPLQLMLMFL